MKVRVHVDIEVIDVLLLRATTAFMDPTATTVARVHRLVTGQGYLWAEGVAGVVVLDSAASELVGP